MIKHTISTIKTYISVVENMKLHIAVKSTHNLELLRVLSNYLDGCDVASIGELFLAKDAGFKNITTTSPGYKVDDFNILNSNDIVPDIDSISQLETYLMSNSPNSIGLRIKVLLDKKYQNDFTFMEDSRFGIEDYNRACDIANNSGVAIKNLHIHTGQSNPTDFIEKFKYILDIASEIKTVETINLGGGLFHFFLDETKACSALEEVSFIIKNWKHKTNRELKIIIEPGALLLGGNGFLVSEIASISKYKDYDNIIMDVSPWNISPWIKPKIFVINKYQEQQEKLYYISGNSLYENDFLTFENGKPEKYSLPVNLSTKDRLLLAGMGAYTSTNKRYFNKLKDTRLYLLKENGDLLKL